MSKMSDVSQLHVDIKTAIVIKAAIASHADTVKIARLVTDIN